MSEKTNGMKLATILLFVSAFAYGQRTLTGGTFTDYVDSIKVKSSTITFNLSLLPDSSITKTSAVWQHEPEMKLGLYIPSEHSHYDLCEHDRLIRDLLKRVEELESKLLTK